MPLWIPYFLVAFGVFIVSTGIPNVSGDIQECESIRKNGRAKICFAVVLIISIFFCAFKSVSAASIDEYAYHNRFRFYAGLNLLEALNESQGELLNGFLVWLSTRLFDSTQGIFIVFGGLTAYFYLVAIRRYAFDFSFGALLLFQMGIINTSFNITQQALACAIFLCYSNVLIERKIWKYILLVIVCSLIHQSAIVLMLLWFFSSEDGMVNEKKLAYALLAILGIFAIYRNIPYLSDNMNFFKSYSGLLEADHPGVRWITIAISCVPAALALYYMKMHYEMDKSTLLFVNICVLNGAISIASSLDRYIARLGMYTIPFSLIFLTRCSDMFEENSRSLFKFITILLYSIVLWLLMRGYRYNLNFQF